jgi:hypothetical protein
MVYAEVSYKSLGKKSQLPIRWDQQRPYATRFIVGLEPTGIIRFPLPAGSYRGLYMGYHYHGLQGVNLIYLKINPPLRCSDKPIVPVVDVEASGTIAIAGKESTQEMPVRGVGVYLRATQWEVHF